MALVFHRTLPIPLWGIAFFAVAVAAPPASTLVLMPLTVCVMAALGIAAVAFLTPGIVPWSRPSRALVHVPPSGRRDRPSAGTTTAGETGVWTPGELKRSTVADALDLVRMDDDGGWQRPRAPA